MKRKSRSESADNTEEDKFNFDIPEYDVDPSRPLSVSISRNKRQEHPHADQVDISKTRNEISDMILPIEYHPIGFTSEDQAMAEFADPLSDQLYDNYHKKMLKQETRMMNDESNHSDLEADRLEGILDHLEVASWRLYLPKVTIVKDLFDEDELHAKKELTQRTIRLMLKKYKYMKHRINIHARKQRHFMIDSSKRLDKLFSKVDKSMIIGYHSSSEDEEDNLDATEIKRRRKMLKHKHFSSPLVIPLSTPSAPTSFKYGIIAEPLNSPFIIKFTKEERLKCLRKVENYKKRYHLIEHFPNQQMKIIKKVAATCELDPFPSDSALPVTSRKTSFKTDHK